MAWDVETYFFYWMEGFAASRGVDAGDGSNSALRLDCSLAICWCILFRRSCKRVYRVVNKALFSHFFGTVAGERSPNSVYKY
jgi:hypothetical protein